MLLIVAFSVALITNFLKEYLHITPKGHLNIDWREMKDKFRDMPMMTEYFGYVLGILAYNSTLSQVTIVPELVKAPQTCLIQSKSLQHNPNKHFFKLPLFMASLFALVLKIGIGVTGAMAIFAAEETK